MKNSHPDCSALEERVLYSALSIGSLIDDGSCEACEPDEAAHVDEVDAEVLLEAPDAFEDTLNSQTNELVFIDLGVDDYESLVNDTRDLRADDLR